MTDVRFWKKRSKSETLRFYALETCTKVARIMNDCLFNTNKNKTKKYYQSYSPKLTF